MPGFGQGAFGSQPFGQFPWSKAVLYDLLPSLYQQQDQAQGGVLQTWTQSLRYDFDLMLALIQSWSTLRDPLQVRTAYDEVTTVVLGPNVTPPAPITQRGVDGSINVSKQFTSPTARFHATDVGNKLTLFNSNVPINNRTFVVASIVNPTTITCDPPLVVDTGPIKWQLQGPSPLPAGVLAIEIHGGDVSKVAPGWVLYDGFSQFTVYERQQFFPLSNQTANLTVQDGLQGIVLGDGTFEAEVAFAQTNVGQPFSVSGSTVQIPNSDFTNNGKYQIYAVSIINPRVLTFHAPLTLELVDPDGTVHSDTAVVYTMTNGHSGVQVAHINYGPSVTLFVIVAGNQINVYLGTDGLGNVTSTAAQVVAAVNGFPAAAALVTASLAPGSAGGGIVIVTPFQTIPGTRLIPDPGPLAWSLLSFPQLQLTANAPPAGITAQEGINLLLIGPIASAVTAKFSAVDVGNILVVRGSALGNDGIYKITGFINTTQVTISPSSKPSGTTASITSYLLPLATLTGLSGITPAMVGYYIQISGAATAANNGQFQIITYFSPTSVAVENPLGSAPDANNGSISWAVIDNGTVVYDPVGIPSNLTWSEHTVSGIGDGTQATINAPSLIDFLAQDFGITIDERESEARQRSWVANVTQWIGLKGTAKSYEIIGAISGFNVTVDALYRVSQPISMTVPDTTIYIVGETGVGRSGVDGTLTASFGFLIFTSPTAQFVPSDVGLNIELTNCSFPGNNALYTIYQYLSPTSVEFAPYNTGATPDYGNGGTNTHPDIEWSVCRIYTTQVPTWPLFDDVDTELMQSIVGVNNFLVDDYCWQSNFVNELPVNITSVTPNTSNGVPVYFDVVAEGVAYVPGPYTSMAVVGAPGHWQITDNAGQLFFIEPPASPVQSITLGTGNSALTFTAKIQGNTSITITLEPAAGVSASAIGQQITITFGAGTTAAQVVTAVQASLAVSALVTVTAGGDGSGTLAPVATTFLEGGFTPVQLISAGPPPVHRFRVFSSDVPLTGPATLQYNCPIVTACNYCKASSVLALISEGSIAGESGLAIEDVFNRVVARMIAEVKPAHVQLIPVYQRTLQASLNITASIIANIEIFAVMLASEQPYYDILSGDGYAPDLYPPVEGGGAASISAFASPTATVTGLTGMSPASVGASLFLASAASTNNNGRFIITGYLSPSSVQIRNPAAVAPDANNGKIEWLIEGPGLFAVIRPGPPPPSTLWVADGGFSGYPTEPDPRLTLIRVIDPTGPSLTHTIDISAFAAAPPFSTTIRMLRMASDGIHVLACLHTAPPNYSQPFPWAQGAVLFIDKNTLAVVGVAQLQLTSAGFQNVQGARDCVDTGDGHLWVINASGGNTANQVETFDIATVLANGPGTPTPSFQQLTIANHAEELCFDGTFIWTAAGNYSTIITRIDPTSNTATTYTGGTYFWGMTAAYGSLWCGDSVRSGTWYRFDPTQFPNFGFVAETFQPPLAFPSATGEPPVYNGFASDGTSLWVSGGFSASMSGGQFMQWWQVGQTPGTSDHFFTPRDQYVNLNTGLIWVTDQASTKINVIDGYAGTFAFAVDVSSTGWNGSRRIVGDLVNVYVGAASSTNYNTLAIISQSTRQIVGLCNLPVGFQVRDIAVNGDALWVVGRNQSSSTLSKVYKFSVSSAIGSFPTPESPTVTSPSTRAYHVLCYDPVTNTVFAGTKNNGVGEILAQLDPTTLADVATQNFLTSATFDWFQFLLAAQSSIWVGTDNPGIIRIDPTTFPTTGITIALGEGQWSSALFYDFNSNTVLVGDDSGGQTIARVSVASNTEVSHFTITPTLGGAGYCSSAIVMQNGFAGPRFIWVTGSDGSVAHTNSGLYEFTATVGSETQLGVIHSWAPLPILATLTDTSVDPSWIGGGSNSSGTYDSDNNRVWFVRWSASGSGPENVYNGIMSINPTTPAIDINNFNGGGTGYWQAPRNILWVPG